MKISYLITCCNETDTLINLLELIGTTIKSCDDELIVVIDKDCNDNQSTRDILSRLAVKMSYNLVEKKNLKILHHSLEKDYSAHKNWAKSQCSGDLIFQLDGDELPSLALINNIHDIVELNPDVDLFWIPRANYFKGVNETHAKQWGWRLSNSKITGEPLVNYPDYQGRLFKHKPELKWVGRLHERIEGYTSHTFLPDDEELSIAHIKSIEKQVETNLRYNKDFTEKENQGFKIPK